MDLPVMEVDNGKDGGGNVLPEGASPLAEVGELVDSDEFEGGDGVDDDSVRELFVQYYRDCFSTLYDVLGECLGEYDYPGDFLAIANLEGDRCEKNEAQRKVTWVVIENLASCMQRDKIYFHGKFLTSIQISCTGLWFRQQLLSPISPKGIICMS